MLTLAAALTICLAEKPLAVMVHGAGGGGWEYFLWEPVFERAGYEVIKIEQYDNLDVMLTRMSLKKYGRLRRAVLTVVHLFAGMLQMRNQLIAYARPKGTDDIAVGGPSSLG